MLLSGTQMHIVTFMFVCIEIVILFYLLIYRAARPDDNTASLNIVLIFLLLCYNVASGFLPDQNLPGSVFLQNIIAYAAGYITPCWFPFYVYKAFDLKKMKFHAYRGVYMFLIMPYFVFVAAYAISNNLEIAKNVLILPMIYALWVITSLVNAIKFKYSNNLSTIKFKEELAILFFSLSSWVLLPIIVYFNWSQVVEASVTNAGFLMLLGLHVKRHIKESREEHHRLIESEQQLLNWNSSLKNEVHKRTRELERINEQKTNTFVNLAHETKTPLTLINNYLEEYINKTEASEEITIIKKNLDKLSTDIINFFDLERFNKGIAIYNHDLISNFSEILKDNLILFKEFSKKRKIVLNDFIEDNVLVKADPVAINRTINNLIENAIKYSENDCVIEISLESHKGKNIFSVRDCGIGIPPEMHKKVFEPYYQIANQKGSTQGMGLGLPIVKKIIQELKGEVRIDSDPKIAPGTKITVVLDKHILSANESISSDVIISSKGRGNIEDIDVKQSDFDERKETILILEDNIAMVNYLIKKLQGNYNVVAALNGNEALIKLKSRAVQPNLIISDIMMDKMDGYTFAKIISNDPVYNHIPFIFLSAKSTRSDKLQGLKLGAIDFIQKPFSIDELNKKIESILANAGKQKKAALTTAFNALSASENFKSPIISNNFDQNCQLYNLTSREKDIAKLICEGNKYKDIGETLFISERTVTKHAQNIFEKVQVSNKIELINKLGC
ncbi:MAG: ATP-binding protein [Chitinophagaceae bacterium]